jgi:two-component system sensor histidine kinase/response regulator
MDRPRKILIVEDRPDDAELSARALNRAGIEHTYWRVETADAMRAALREERWDIVIADYSMPQFSGLAALELLRDSRIEIPFILVSGTMGEENAVEAMRRGANDYVLKNNLARLPLAVERELREFEVRTERNRAQERYRSLAERVPVGLFRVSPAGEIVEANPAMAAMLGFSDSESVRGINVSELWLRPDERERLLATMRRDGAVQNFAMEMRRPDGSVIWIEQSARAVFEPPGRLAYYEGVLVDVTARKRAEEEANRARDKVRDLALETAQLRADFLASMSHEIRTPLVGIIGTGELLSHSTLSQEQRRLLEIIRSSGELLLTIVNDILDFSKLAAGRLELDNLDFDLVEVVNSTVDSFAATASAKGVELALHADIRMPTGLRGDQSRLRQILSNLVANAIKFTEQGEVTVRVRRLEETANDVLVRFDVIDTGIGVPLAAQGRLFQPFVQAEGSTHRRFGGTGLGLVIAAKLTEQMGGAIGFESEPGKGSTFHFTARLEKGAEIVHPWMNPTALSSLGGVRAIAVHDSPASRGIISDYLSSWGIEHSTVGNAAEALEILKREADRDPRQLVLLIDEQTPDMGALRLARAIKEDWGKEHCKVIMLSADSGAHNASEAVDAWITKPVHPSHLFNSLLEVCAGTAAIEEGVKRPTGPIAEGLPLWRKGVRVLLVDDNQVNRTIGAKQLTMLGFAAEVADGAARALEMLSNQDFDVVLMDCEMPEMDGYQAVAEIRRREGGARHMPVIALTAHAMEDERAKCLNAGMDDYLSKPVKLNALADKLDSWTHLKADAIAASVDQARRDSVGGRSGG